MIDRIKKIIEQIDNLKADAFIISNKANKLYVSGFTGSTGYVVISKKEKIIYTDGRYFEQIKLQSPNFEIVDSSKIKLNDVLKLKGLSNVLIEAGNMTAGEARELTSSRINLVYVDNIVEKIRMHKENFEIDSIQKAAQITDEVFNEVLDIIKPGISELDIANEIDYLGKKKGALSPSFETIVASGVRSSLPHGHASGKKIGNHELVILDFGFVYDRYYSDITRTISIGSVSEELKNIYQVTKDAQEIAINGLHRNMQYKDIDSLARTYIEDKGLGQYFVHGTGHGIGLECHEYPLLNQYSTEDLYSNMTFTVEPGIYLPQKGGVRIEDDVYLNENDEIKLLTHSRKDWIEL